MKEHAGAINKGFCFMRMVLLKIKLIMTLS